MRPALPTSPLLFAALLAALGVAGCAGPAPADVATAHESLAALPDCAYVPVDASYRASPSSEDGIYVVRTGTQLVCATDFAGLELLARRIDGIDPVDAPSTDVSSSNPMPGRGTDPAASNPMPGRDPSNLARMQAAPSAS